MKITGFFVVDEQDTCRRAICECDRRLATDLAKLEDTASMDFHSKPDFRNFLTHWFPLVSYTLVPAGAKFAHFGLCGEIARDGEIVENRG